MNQYHRFYITIEWVYPYGFYKGYERTKQLDFTYQTNESISLMIQVLGVNHAFGLYNCLEWTICIDITGNRNEPFVKFLQVKKNESHMEFLQTFRVNYMHMMLQTDRMNHKYWDCKQAEWILTTDFTTKRVS